MANFFPNMMKTINPDTELSRQTPRKINTMKAILRHIIVTLMETKDEF